MGEDPLSQPRRLCARRADTQPHRAGCLFREECQRLAHDCIRAGRRRVALSAGIRPVLTARTLLLSVLVTHHAFALDVQGHRGARGDDSVRFNIETKLSPLAPQETAPPEMFARALLAVVRGAGMEARVTVQSFDWRTLQVVQTDAPQIPTAYL